MTTARYGVIAALAAIAALGLSEGATARQGDRAGVFDYYVLALSWSPTYCETVGRQRKDAQCDGRRPYAFVLHGLWPQYQKGWPEHCRTAQKPWVPRQLISAMLDIMPSPKLVIHEYKKHGTCSGLTPEGYYAAARKAFESIKIPARYLAPNRAVTVSPRQIEIDFLKTNAALTPEMISVACGRGKRLREVRICFSRSLELSACGVNEDQRKLCRQDRIVMPPVRGLAR
ncbi:MAG: ribonuclease T2 family protein [Methyloligellaceae bacterium]